MDLFHFTLNGHHNYTTITLMVGFWPKECVSDLYRLLLNPTKHGTLVHGSDNLCELWHRRLGHLHYGALPLLKDMVQGLSDFKV
jgi:hypothetical protein